MGLFYKGDALGTGHMRKRGHKAELKEEDRIRTVLLEVFSLLLRARIASWPLLLMEWTAELIQQFFIIMPLQCDTGFKGWILWKDAKSAYDIWG